MKSIVFTFFFCCLSVASDSIQEKLGLKSIEDIQIYGKNEILFSDVGRAEEFQGILIQLNQPNHELSKADLYIFSQETKIAMTENLCTTYVKNIFGDSKQTGLVLASKLTLFETSTGKACEFQLNDSDAKAKIPIRYVIAGFVHGRMTALVWQLYKLSDENKLKLQKFWKSLR